MVTLAELQPGQSAQIAEINSEDGGRLMKLAALGVVPGSLIRLQQRKPVFIVWVGETLLSLEQTVAQDIVLFPPRS
ncbi:MAG: FeoA family protein [Anaerolineae bacterium]|nr:FeoA family protein [Anaerolineae bacterium]